MKEVENVVSEEVRKMNIVCLRIRNNLEKNCINDAFIFFKLILNHKPCDKEIRSLLMVWTLDSV